MEQVNVQENYVPSSWEVHKTSERQYIHCSNLKPDLSDILKSI